MNNLTDKEYCKFFKMKFEDASNDWLLASKIIKRKASAPGMGWKWTDIKERRFFLIKKLKNGDRTDCRIPNHVNRPYPVTKKMKLKEVFM